MKTNYANGKLLITGEYLVLEGANSLAIPCAKGQRIEYTPNNKINTIDWTSLDYLNKEWFSAKFESDSLDILSSSDKYKAKHLQKMLIEAYKLSNDKLSGQIKTTLEFPNDWGLGSSSTLIVCIS
ncbi:MAG: GHMP kinase, partial [Flavobacteriales bacterium]|nr:GHMP kinase [Flavobacteriales bacterium]